MENFVAIPFSDYMAFASVICQKAGLPSALEISELMKMMEELEKSSHPEVGFVPTEWDENGYATKGKFYGTVVPACLFKPAVGSVSPDSTEPVTFSVLQSVDLTGVVEIGARAFESFTGEMDSLPDSIQTIGYHAFYNAKGLTITKLPDSLVTLGENAFQNSGIAITDFPVGVTEIPTRCFANCKSLVNLSLSSVKTVGEYAFYNAGLETVHFGEVETIGSYAFYANSEKNGRLVEIDLAGVKSIGERAFWLQVLLANTPGEDALVIPGSVESIGAYAFRGCNSLTKVRFLGTPSSIAATAFVPVSGDDGIEDIYVPWAEGEVENAPWGAENATVHYNSPIEEE